ncbi:MAG: LacI family DNA-binding transcriptional regulator [Bryobacteraceae bacterium]|nr:LacI family DNA-binding transcriptional regulator [Bryobacteraceae bacterium]
MATIRHVAAKARVSVGTVSNVLSNARGVSAELRERVERAICELDYHPSHIARSLASRQTKTIGIVITDITNPFFPLLVRGAEDAALLRGFTLSVFNTDNRLDRERNCISVLRSREADGVLLVASPNPGGSIEHLEDARKSGLSMVCLDRIPQGFRCDAVLANHEKGARLIVRHLHLMGHRRIGAILGPAGLQNSSDRTAGYRGALAECGIETHADLERQGNFRMESGHRLAKDLLLSGSPPTAIFAANGMMGLGVLKAIQELGLNCPQQISLAVFDDYPGADIFRPSLTVISQPAYEMGYLGTELLIERIVEASSKNVETAWEPRVKILEPELIVRESTAAPGTP